MSGGNVGFGVLAGFEVSLVNGAGDFVHERSLPPPAAPTHFSLSLAVGVSEKRVRANMEETILASGTKRNYDTTTARRSDTVSLSLGAIHG